jgi:hypothetical protein
VPQLEHAAPWRHVRDCIQCNFRARRLDILKDAPKLDQTNNPDFHDKGGNKFKRMHDWTDDKGYHQVWVTVGNIDTRAHYRTVGQYLDTPPPAKKP